MSAAAPAGLGAVATLRRRLLSSALAGWLGAAPAAADVVEPAEQPRLALASIDEALTFARVDAGGRRRVIAVNRYGPADVDGVDLTALLGGDADDPIALYLAHGYDGLRGAIAAAPASAATRLPIAELAQPVDLRDHHIAVGTNYREHAGDAGTVRPFLFPKLVQPTGPRAPVAAGDGLLDYEVEIAFVTLTRQPHEAAAPVLGVVLCNDYTDRETLMRLVDPRDIESGRGFTTGKSFPGYLPVGDLFVIPRDVRAFVRGLELQLSVNGAPRQRAAAAEMIWDLDAILAHTWEQRRTRWQHGDDTVGLLDGNDAIPARTLIMSGTPHGTVFNGVPARNKLAGAMAWALGGWDQSIEQRVIEAYLADAHAAGIYLQPGDRVAIRVARLGSIENRVVR